MSFSQSKFEIGRCFQDRVKLAPPPSVTHTGTHRYCTLYIYSQLALPPPLHAVLNTLEVARRRVLGPLGAALLPRRLPSCCSSGGGGGLEPARAEPAPRQPRPAELLAERHRRRVAGVRAVAVADALLELPFV